MNGIKLRFAVACACAILASIAYGRSMLLPFIGDDYLQIDLARRYGAIEGWRDLAADALYRCRATSLILTHWTERAFGVDHLFFNLSTLAIHVLNCLLVLSLGAWRVVGWRIAMLGAVFFAFQERPHEAVIWYAALPELLVFTFSLISLTLWVRWLQAECPSGRLYAGCFLAFLLALASKESAVCVTGLMALSLALERSAGKRRWYAALPFAALSVLYFTSIYQAKASHLHFNDGTFSLSAPFWSTLAHTARRMFWPWGLAALGALAALSRLRPRFALLLAGWVAITLLPYSFLTYMNSAPSRHTYFASVAVAFSLGAATLALWQWLARRRLKALIAIPLLACFLQNTAYLWTTKHRQFRQRANATQAVLHALEDGKSKVEVVCFPYDTLFAELAVSIENPEAAPRLLIHKAAGCGKDSLILRPVLQR